MTNRYQTLNVSLQTDNRNSSRIIKTIEVDHGTRGTGDNDQTENDQRVNKFKELYYKNEKLRRDLKALNQKLNQKLDKLKLPNVRKKAQSVDLNHVPPSKALQRQLENAYKQVNMYKKQIELLKLKEESKENFQRLKNMEDSITYKDYEIAQIQQELKSIKNVKKLQERVIVADLENVDLKERLEQYQKEYQVYRDKMTEINKKARKRQQQYKKQQAYQVNLEAKLRQANGPNFKQEPSAPPPPPVQEVTDLEFKLVKEEIAKCKKDNEDTCKRVDQTRKATKLLKHEREEVDQKLKEKDAIAKTLVLKIQSYKRLLKDLQGKKSVFQKFTNDEKSNNLLKLEQLDLESESENGEGSPQIPPESPQISISQPPSMFSAEKDEREWKGKSRKVSMGYMSASDSLFQESGKLLGLKIFLDQNKVICGLIGILLDDTSGRRQTKLMGNQSSIELKWQVPAGDSISKITGGFTEQGYLGELILLSQGGLSGKFGHSYTDIFIFRLEKDECFSGIFGGIRRLGQDARITQIGFWITKK